MTTTTNPPDFSGGPSPRGSILGNAVRRVEDPKILRGEAVYFDDLSPTGLAHLVFVRSTIAHARVTNIDTREAETMPGVVAVYTHENIGLEPNVSFAMLPDSFARPPLANGTVRFVGDMVAAVVAETRAQAVDAAEMVIVDYDPLPVVVDPEAALADGAPILFPNLATNVAIEFNFADADPELMAEAEVVISGRFVNQRVAPVPMEPNGIVVEFDKEKNLSLTVPTQAPFGVRDPVAKAFGLDPEKVRVRAPAVGGGFGAKSGCYVE